MIARKKTAIITAQELLSKYTDYLLEREEKPSSIYKFCKEIGIKESEFYKYFASFEMIESAFFEALHEHTLKLLHNNSEYAVYDDESKLLSYYFTFFEMATANRSYILICLKKNDYPLESLTRLGGLRKVFLAFTETITTNNTKMPDEKLKKVESQLIQEAAWIQFLFILRFWMNDNSPSFEKTDILIEKSLRARFDVIENIPMKSLIDLGKFLWKENPFK